MPTALARRVWALLQQVINGSGFGSVTIVVENGKIKRLQVTVHEPVGPINEPGKSKQPNRVPSRWTAYHLRSLTVVKRSRGTGLVV